MNEWKFLFFRAHPYKGSLVFISEDKQKRSNSLKMVTLFQNTICYSEFQTAVEIHTSLCGDFKQDLPHLSQADCGWKQRIFTLCLTSSASWGLTSPSPQGIFSLRLPLRKKRALGFSSSPNHSQFLIYALKASDSASLSLTLCYLCPRWIWSKTDTRDLTLLSSGLLVYHLCSVACCHLLVW